MCACETSFRQTRSLYPLELVDENPKGSVYNIAKVPTNSVTPNLEFYCILSHASKLLGLLHFMHACLVLNRQ